MKPIAQPLQAPDDGLAETPLYLQIVEMLRREIVTGLYPVGTALPSESVLVQRFGVSRHTVREALRSLRESGLVVSRKGLGTIVKRPSDELGYVHRVEAIGDLFPPDVVTRYAVDHGGFASLPCDFKMSDNLDTRWLRVRGTRTRHGAATPFNEVDVYIASRFAGIGRLVDMQDGPLYGMIEMLYGGTIGKVEQVFGAFVCDGEIGRAIGLGCGDVGISIRRVYYMSGDPNVAMISFNRYLPEAFSFSMTLNRVRNSSSA